MYGYIYETLNLINNKKYIGKHKCSEFDPNYIGSGIALSKAIVKYGKENFLCKLLITADSDEELNKLEKIYIKNSDAVISSNYYNIAEGGQGGNTLSGFSEDQYQNFCNNIKNRWEDINYKKEVSKKISESLKGKRKSEQHIKNLHEARVKNRTNVGENNPMYNRHRFGKDAPTYGYHFYNNGNTEIYVSEETYIDLYKDTYVKGRLKDNITKLHEGNKGRIRIYKDNVQKRVLPENLNNFLLDGWSLNK